MSTGTVYCCTLR